MIRLISSPVGENLPFGGSTQVRHKPGCMGTGASDRLEISDRETRAIMLTANRQLKTKALISR